MTVAPPPISEHDELAADVSEAEERWFGVPATMTIVAPTRAAADEFAATIAKERLSQMLDFGVKDVRVVGRRPPGTEAPGASVTWVLEALFAVNAVDAAEARRDVERVCRRDATESYLFLGFGRAREIEDEERLNAMCRRLFRDAAVVLVGELRDDLAELAQGVPFDETMMFSEVLPPVLRAAYDLPLMERFVDTVEAVGVDLLRYPETYLASTAEELAAHAIIGEARVLLDNLGTTPEGEAAREQLKEQLEYLHELAFEDHDILWAWDKNLSEYVTRVADFAPENWFKPFQGPPDE